VDAPNALPVRFPAANLATVRERIRAVLTEVIATVVVASAACGADLLALDVARELGIRCAIVLPWDRADFREISVVDRGGEWGGMFDRVVNVAGDAGDLYTLGRGVHDARAFIATNDTILDMAQTIAGAVHPTDEVVAMVAWDGGSRGADDVTAQFITSARGRGLRVVEILTV
jgi:hypothetical protein